MTELINNNELKQFMKTKEFEKRLKDQSLHSTKSSYFQQDEYPVKEETAMAINR